MPVTASECGDVQFRVRTTLRIRGKKENERASKRTPSTSAVGGLLLKDVLM